MKDYAKLTVGLSAVVAGMTIAYKVACVAGDKLGKLFAEKAKLEKLKIKKEQKTES